MAASPELNKTSTVIKQFVVDYTTATFEPLTEHEVGGLDYRYVYGNDRLSVNITGVETSSGNLIENGNQIRLYYHMDYLGTADYLTSPVTGKVTSWTHYNEWGEITHNAVLKSGQRELDLVKRYATHDYDAVLGMYYAKARMYDAENRRFAAVDPVKGRITEPMTMVQYLYVVDNPLGWVDPLGKEPISNYPGAYIQLSNGNVLEDVGWYVYGDPKDYYVDFESALKAYGVKTRRTNVAYDSKGIGYQSIFLYAPDSRSYVQFQIESRIPYNYQRINATLHSSTDNWGISKNYGWSQMYYSRHDSKYHKMINLNYFKRLMCDLGYNITAEVKSRAVENARSLSQNMKNLMHKYETGADQNGNYLREGEPALKPYHAASDASTVHTIGWGHAMWGYSPYTLRSGENVDLYNWNTEITWGDAEDIYEKDVQIREKEFNSFLDKYGVIMTQQQYDAFFSLGYQVGFNYLTDLEKYSIARWIAFGDLNDAKLAKIAFGDFTNGLEQGTMLRRLDELDVFLYGQYKREYDINRYGDIWRQDFTWYPN